ncbi:hypothetical protein ACWD3I_48750 [Streptomyces sp. NPDC002817]|uniref:hypothetical protein n=1 Tax=Streptomyces sp. NPDC088357 TaxID=3154655 RepID=UPI00341E6056
MLHDLAESLEAEGTRLRLPDGRRLPELLLAEGGHLLPGARYHRRTDDDSGPDLDATVAILAWDRKRRTAVELVVLDGDPDSPGSMTCALWLASGERPRAASLSVKWRAGGGRWTSYAVGDGRLHLDLGEWWSSAAGGGRLAAAPLTGRLDHGLARASLTVVPRPADDGRWRVTVTARVKGRSFTRPLVPLAMTVVGRRAHGIFAKALDDAARQWNNRVPEMVRQDTQQLHLKITESLGGAEAERAAQAAGGTE